MSDIGATNVTVVSEQWERLPSFYFDSRSRIQIRDLLCENSEESEVATGQFKLRKFAGREGGSRYFEGSVSSRRPRSRFRDFIIESIGQML